METPDGKLDRHDQRDRGKRIAYERTVAEIEAMSHDVALDLDIFREDARKIARQAVYGQ